MQTANLFFLKKRTASPTPETLCLHNRMTRYSQSVAIKTMRQIQSSSGEPKRAKNSRKRMDKEKCDGKRASECLKVVNCRATSQELLLFLV